MCSRENKIAYLSFPNTIPASLVLSSPMSSGDIISYVPLCFSIPSYNNFQEKGLHQRTALMRAYGKVTKEITGMLASKEPDLKIFATNRENTKVVLFCIWYWFE